MIRKALYVGSFDPITNGHLNIIKRAAKVFDELTVAVVVNPGKNCLLDLDERVNLVAECTGDLGNVKVDKFQGLLADYVNSNKYTAVIRGLRGVCDFDNEITMAQINARLYTENTETVFLMTDPEFSYISSSMVKEVASLDGDIEPFVPHCVAVKIKDKYKGGL